MAQEKRTGQIVLDSQNQIPAWYYVETSMETSPNLGYELGIVGPTGRRRTLGILSDKSVVWTTDSNVQRHPDLASLEGSAIYAQFQNHRVGGERLPRIYVSGSEIGRLIHLAHHILLASPNGLLNISLNLTPNFDQPREIYKGTIADLRRNITYLH